VIFSEFGVDQLIEGNKCGITCTQYTPLSWAEALHNRHYDFNAWRVMGMNLAGVALYCFCTDDWYAYNFDGYLNNYVDLLPEEISPIAGDPFPASP